MTFEQWVKENYGYNPSEKDVNFMMHRESWDYLQNKIASLEKDISETIFREESLIATLEKLKSEFPSIYEELTKKEKS